MLRDKVCNSKKSVDTSAAELLWLAACLNVGWLSTLRTTGRRVFHVCGMEAEKTRLPNSVCFYWRQQLWLTTTWADVVVSLPRWTVEYRL